MRIKTKIMISILVIAALISVLSATFVLAKPDLTPTYTKVGPSNGRATVIIPAHAIEVAPGVFDLGLTVHNGKIVQGYAFVHYKDRTAKPTCNYNEVCEPELGEKKNCADCKAGNGGGNGGPDTSTCYGFLAEGAKWKTLEDYIVDPTNIRGLDENFVRNNLASDIGKWETAAEVDILGNEVSGIVDGADTETPDDKNEVYFTDISGRGAIAITFVWGIYGGPVEDRELIEWDQVYDDVDFDWSADCLAENCVKAKKMDFEDIATHELGHSVGLDDLYSKKCSAVTMYGKAGYGETDKRTLEDGDINGVKALYA